MHQFYLHATVILIQNMANEFKFNPMLLLLFVLYSPFEWWRLAPSRSLRWPSNRVKGMLPLAQPGALVTHAPSGRARLSGRLRMPSAVH
jgi:hypothetical protein